MARKNYAGPPRFHPAIYESPRFAWVPVFKQETESGSSKLLHDRRLPPRLPHRTADDRHQGQQRGRHQHDQRPRCESANKLETIKIVFLNPNALPDGTATTPIGPYLGVGPQVIRLVE